LAERIPSPSLSLKPYAITRLLDGVGELMREEPLTPGGMRLETSSSKDDVAADRERERTLTLRGRVGAGVVMYSHTGQARPETGFEPRSKCRIQRLARSNILAGIRGRVG
jgi:hypothetical protein